MGMCRTLVFARERSAASILEAMKAGRVVAVTNDGRTAGDPHWIQALSEAGVRSRASANTAPPSAHLRVAERVLAWLIVAILVLALLRRTPLRPRPELRPWRRR